MKLERLKPFVNDPLLWKPFEEYLDMRIDYAYANMDRIDSPNDFYREQGVVRALKRLKQMRDEVNGTRT